MPSTSPAQKRTMAAIAHGWKPSSPDLQKIPVTVAKDFNQADEAQSPRKRLVAAMMKGKNR